MRDEQSVVMHLLLSAANDDYYGLYEAIWELNGQFPAKTIGWKYDAASAALRELYSRKWIQFFRSDTRADEERFEAFTPDNLEEMLETPVCWYPSYGGERISFTTTDEGDDAYVHDVLGFRKKD